MAEELTCDHCGSKYEYDSQDRRGHRRYACASCKVKAHRLRKKEELIEEFGGECEECGYNDCIRELTFHHVKPDNKEFDLSGNNLRRDWDKVMKEANKCKLLCSNCHAKTHCDRCGKDSFDL